MLSAWPLAAATRLVGAGALERPGVAMLFSSGRLVIEQPADTKKCPGASSAALRAWFGSTRAGCDRGPEPIGGARRYLPAN